ncbi:Colicin I receptor [Thalassocella blandensis]|nr:Colicin I receptor [Thalassocella blandensis]
MNQRLHKRGNRLQKSILSLAIATSIPLALPDIVSAQEIKSAVESEMNTVDFNIPPGSLTSALNNLALQAGVTLSFNAATVKHKNSEGLNGRYTASRGFAILLSGSGYEARQTEQGFVLVKQKPVESASSNDNVYQLDKVVVTAAGFEQNIMDAPASISVIDADELKFKEYSNVTDALRHVAGVNVVGSGIEQGISIRGMDPEFTLFLVDGRPVSGLDAFDLVRGANVGGNSVNLLPPLSAIERIEVIRGPASALYGSDAMGGVINIITKKSNNTWGGSVSTELTVSDNDISENSALTNLTVNAPLIKDRLSVLLTGAFQTIEESHYYGDGSQPKYEQINYGTKFSWRVSDQDSFTFGNNYVQGDRSREPGKSLDPESEPGEVDNSRSIRESYFITHEGKYDVLTWNSYINLDVSKNDTSGIKYEVLTLNPQATGVFGAHVFTGGLNYKDESLENGPVNDLPGNDGTLERWDAAVFLEDAWTIAKGRTVTLSGRYDDNENFGGHFSPKIYGVFYLTGNLALKGGLTSGYKVAKLADAAPDYASGSRGGARLGNPNLDPEESLNRELGLAYDNLTIGLNTSFTAYQTDYKNKLARSGQVCEADVVCEFNGFTYPPNSSGYTTTINIEEAETYGVEHKLDYRISDSLKYRHNYTYTKTEYTVGDASGVPLRDNPKHMFNASLYWEPSITTTLWTQVNYVGKTSGNQGSVRGAATGEFDPESVHDAYSTADVGFNYKMLSRLNLGLGLYNISNKLITTEDGYSSTLDGRRFVANVNFEF